MKEIRISLEGQSARNANKLFKELTFFLTEFENRTNKNNKSSEICVTAYKKISKYRRDAC